jgi:hypothetical protein
MYVVFLEKIMCFLTMLKPDGYLWQRVHILYTLNGLFDIGTRNVTE